MMKRLSRLLPLVGLILLFAWNARAHKVNLFAYVESNTVYTESYFPDGRPVKDGTVLVFDSQDRLLLQGTTDSGGLFHFDLPKVDELRIVVKASMGHRAVFELPESEVEAGR